jgi:hypothetical protein
MTRGLSIAILVLLMATTSGQMTLAQAGDPTLFASELGDIRMDFKRPQTDGNWVVWAQYGYHPHTPYSTLLAARPDDPRPVAIGRIPGMYFDLHNGVVVWADPNYNNVDRGVWVHDLAAETTITISDPAYLGVAYPTLDRLATGSTPPRVAWVQWTQQDVDPGPPWIVRCSIPCVDAPEKLYRLSSSIMRNEFFRLTLVGDQLYWLGLEGELWTFTVGDVAASVLASNVTDFALSGSMIAYLAGASDSGSQIRVIDRNHPEAPTVVTENASSVALGGDGRYVFWTDARQQPLSGVDHYELLGHDLRTESQFVAWLSRPNTDGGELVPARPSTDGHGMLVWAVQKWVPGDPTMSYLDERRTNSFIHAASISAVLPTGARPDPGNDDPHVVWFPQTGHTLGYTFLDYWEANGGLAVHGYPMTEHFFDHGRSVLFTERQRFEWHPQNYGTPWYTILLGRLGDELLQAQGRDWRDFPRSDPAAPHYMSETGHAIDERFWGYWSTHGLDIGDPGTSFRESLALFGYPLSELMLETNSDGHTVLTQYFERAVFEWHADNPEPYRVLLRRLGAEMLTERGW